MEYEYLNLNWDIDKKIQEMEHQLQRLCHIRTATKAAIYFNGSDDKIRDELFHALLLPERNPEIEKFLKKYIVK
jgi:hypothetical protein